MSRYFIHLNLIFTLCIGLNISAFAQVGNGLRGDPEAISDARLMVEKMGGIDIWSQLKSLHFVHQWYPWNRIDTYVENEILDLTGPRSWVDRKSEIDHKMRVYSPEANHWYWQNGEFFYATKEKAAESQKRAPFNFYRLLRGIAVNDEFYEIRYGEGDIPNTKRLEFYGPDGVMRGWVILNIQHEPIVKATNRYRYTLGPLKRFGNVLVPAWGVYGTGYTRYDMISLVGSNKQPDSVLFIPPEEYLDK